ncbi:MAG TPA: hypothetical protein VFR63_09740 [Gaiellaceae bacterium]|nr:hypothetical protein [Gaiellaceae bacterium]
MRTWGIAVAAGILLAAGVAAAVFVFWPSDGDDRTRAADRDQEREGRDGGAGPRTGDVVLEDRAFRCRGEVDLDLVRVTMRTVLDDAIQLDENCSGRIGRVEVETWTADGISVQNHGKVAHDLVVESGYVKCHDVASGAHQDGVQVMGGLRLTFRDLRVDCLGNANFFLAEGGAGASTPTDVVCVGCVLGPNSAQTLFFADSIRSGARQTTICTGRFEAVRVEAGAQAIVEDDNEVLAREDPACADVTGKGEAR